MKRLVSIILALLMTVTTVFASGEVPDFLKEAYTNYTADYSISMTFDSSESIVALLEELDIPEEIGYYVDLESLLRTLLSYEGKMYLQVDMSDDFQKIKLALVSDGVHSIDVNPNLNVGLNMKMGMWMNMDLSNESNPIFDVIYAHPYFNKYIKLSATDVLDEDMLNMLKGMFNKEYMNSLQETAMDIFMKYATIENTGRKYTVKMDNESFTAYMDEIFLMMPDILAPIAGDDVDSYLEFPSVKGWQFLGDNGIESVYFLNGSKLSQEHMSIDVSINIPDIYTAITGEEWPYTSEGKIDFTLSAEADITKIGSTDVEYPALTTENTITLDDLTPDYSYDEYEYEEYPEYPYYFVGGHTDELHIIDGEVYVPLRSTMEDAYDDTVNITYNNGAVTMVCDYFPGYSELIIAVDSDIAYTDGAKHMVAKPILVNGITYVSHQLLSDMLGWKLNYAEHNLIDDTYYYTFQTRW